IPHRYGKNSRAIKSSFSCSEFPFLIGTLRTYVSGRGNDNGREKFPFLIGTVRTHIIAHFLLSILQFPFLIGTVRTRL
ncbi:MAG TPA: hypothetical protein PLM21_07080, partial [Fervidobacterium sp.]|nr:hypothetical protein [Fervidobacterium sp.]